MKHEISIDETASKIPEILRRVETGEQFVVTRHGKPVIEILPSPDTRQEQSRAAIRGLKALMSESRPLSEKQLNQYKNEGRM